MFRRFLFAAVFGVPVAGRAEEAADGSRDPGELLSSVWNFQVVQSDNITVGKIALGIAGLVFALLLARTVSGLTSRAVRRRFTLAVEHADAVQKGVFYLLATLFVLTILNWLSIPLTVFAFLGGAMAIGIGFGTQALMNNFISGVILLFERGVRVGDLIDVDGNVGKVTKLGSRYSQIRKPDGVEVLVPNSMFLEKNVINWTLTDSAHRFDFTIGFAYGSDTAQLMRLLTDILEGHPEILKEPAPAVYFDAFGDSALVFHLYYWLSLDRSNSLLVGSELRLQIDRRCREEGIEIPFPQRDFRLHTTDPLPVTVRRGPEVPPK